MIGVVVLVVLFVGGVECLFWSRRGRRLEGWEPRCARCGYIVLGLSSGVCPECGADLAGAGAVVRPGGRARPRLGVQLAGWTVFSLVSVAVPVTVAWEEWVMPLLPRHYRASGDVTLEQPESKAFVRVVISWTGHRYGRMGPVDAEHMTLRLTPLPPAGPRVMEVDAATMAYEYRDHLGSGSGAPLTGDALVAWAAEAGVATDGMGVPGEMEDFVRQVRAFAKGGTRQSIAIGGQGFHAFSESGRTSTERPVWQRLAPLAPGVVWLVGVVVLVRRGREPEAGTAGEG